MYVFKRICGTWNLELDIFDFFKKDIVLVKNCGCKLRMKIADRNCGWSALVPHGAGEKGGYWKYLIDRYLIYSFLWSVPVYVQNCFRER